LSFGIPFALIPLLLITRDRSIMTGMHNGRLISILMFLTTVIITGLNLYLLYDATVGKI
jgi:manganese transport protein